MDLCILCNKLVLHCGISWCLLAMPACLIGCVLQTQGAPKDGNTLVISTVGATHAPLIRAYMSLERWHMLQFVLLSQLLERYQHQSFAL